MPAKNARHIALSGPLSDFIDEQVALGKYTSASEAVRAAVRLLMEHETGRTEQRARQRTPAKSS